MNSPRQPTPAHRATKRRLFARWRNRNRPDKKRRGAIVVLVAVLLGLFLATAAFSVDVAYMNLVKVELRASTDAAATAAVETLGRTGSTASAQQAAINVAAMNTVAGAPLSLEASDIVFGRSIVQNDGTIAFYAGYTPYSAARVTGRKTSGSPSGSVPLFFARIFDINMFQTQQVATAARWDRDIALVVDRSGSMNFDNKLVDLKDSVSIFLDIIEDNSFRDQIGLASYNHFPTLEYRLTSDLNRIRNEMATMLADGQTNIGGGIYTGQQILTGAGSRPFVEKTMIVMTDGRHNTGFDPIAAARNAANAGIVIHAITFGADAEQARMQTVAQITGGTFHHAPDGEALKEIYRNIALMFGTMLIQ